MRDLCKHYPITAGLMRRQTGEVVRALDGVSFEVGAAETLGIVGESGSGKSTLARTLLRLEEPTSGEARFHGDRIFALQPDRLLAFRRAFQVVFQDPFASLNPRMTVFEIISEPWAIHRDVLPRARWRDRVGGAARAASAWSRTICAAIPTSSRAGSGSGSRSPGRSRSSPS